MVLSDEKIKEYTRRLLKSRMRILCNNGFYGLLIMHMRFAIDENCKTAATDGVKIYFGPKFLDEISDSELDFIMMHEILHVVLQHCTRGVDRDSEKFNIACDIVVNSNILKSFDMDKRKITLAKYGVSMHLTPDGHEGYEYTAEEVYEMLPPVSGNRSINMPGSKVPGVDNGRWDDHTKWESCENDVFLKDLWTKRFEDACESISLRDPKNERGMIPVFARRMLNDLKKPQIDWRMILNNFVQEEIADYSFMPPDRRMDDGDFFLPDFNEKEDVVVDILFMIDTSGSMSDEMITAAYSEVMGAIDQFDGKLKGWLGFFDAEIIEPTPFCCEDEFRVIKPVGGGGTDFLIIFRYVKKYMEDKLPASIIILTDGYAPFPKESETMGIPVLWLLNNDEVNPPWGKVARIKV